METISKQSIKQLYQSIAELGYAFLLSHHPPTEEEITAFKQLIISELKEDFGNPREDYEITKNEISIDLEASYQFALKLIRENRNELNSLIVRRLSYVLEYLADTVGIPEKERTIVNRFEKDLERIFQLKKGLNPTLKMSQEHQALYSTVGQLAYIISMADKRIVPNEKKVFQKIVQENFGVFDRLIEERFQVLQDLGSADLESTYEHSIYLIKKNKKALDDDIIQNIISVMTQIAALRGTTKEEKYFIDRFKEDVHQIYEEKKSEEKPKN